MAYTISTHNGSRYVRAHNIRDRRLTDKEQHIDPDGVYEIWRDEKVRDAYERIFGDAVREYNARQKREDRKIDDYYNLIKGHDKKHVVYEMIISIGNLDYEPDPEVGKKIMREFYENWEKRNPNLDLIGAYYHADEAGVPHIHLDYIPVGEGYTRGLNVQNGLNRALKQQGFESISPKNTAQIQWEKRENLALEKICQEHGLDIVHPEIEDRVHLEKDTFIRVKEQEKAIVELVKAISHDISTPVEPIEVIEEKTSLFGRTAPKKAIFRYEEIMPVLERIPKFEALKALVERLEEATVRVSRSTADFDYQLDHVLERLDDTLAQERVLRKAREDDLKKLRKELDVAESKLYRLDVLKARYPGAVEAFEKAIQEAREKEFSKPYNDNLEKVTNRIIEPDRER
mgnify:CR=1 FL=1